MSLGSSHDYFIQVYFECIQERISGKFIHSWQINGRAVFLSIIAVQYFVSYKCTI